MLTATSDEIVKKLETIHGLKTVGEWVGQVDDLIKKPGNLPSMHVVFGGGKFGDKEMIGSEIVNLSMGWSVVIIAKNLRSRKTNSLECYDLVMEAVTRLKGFKIGGGWLWPRQIALLHAKNGVLVYGLDFSIDSETEE